MDKAITAGLIMNEMMINSYKHGFPGDTKGSITISLAKDGDQISLEVADDGVGLQESNDILKSESLGIELIRILVEQLDGEIQQNTGECGLCYKIYFEG